MDQCNAQTNFSPSVVPTLIINQSTARLSRTCTTTQTEPPSQPTLRGLELIKSCAKFYENGVGVAKPTAQLSHPLGATVNLPATGQTSPSRLFKPSISTAAVMCSFFLVLPSLALATIVWWGATKNGTVGGPEVAADDASAVSAQLGNPAITPLRNLQGAAAAQTVANAQSDIIIHKVKTQPITGDAWGGPDRDRR